jgi:hypothetical protein
VAVPWHHPCVSGTHERISNYAIEGELWIEKSMVPNLLEDLHEKVQVTPELDWN